MNVYKVCFPEVLTPLLTDKNVKPLEVKVEVPTFVPWTANVKAPPSFIPDKVNAPGLFEVNAKLLLVKSIVVEVVALNALEFVALPFTSKETKVSKAKSESNSSKEKEVPTEKVAQ